MANFCENCGSPLKSDNKFCPNCGAPVTQTKPEVPVTPTAPGRSPADAAINVRPANTTTVDAATPFDTPETSPAVTGAAGAAVVATVGALHPDSAPENPQDAFVPLREANPGPQPVHEEAFNENRRTPSTLREEAEQAFPHSDYSRKEGLSQSGTAPKYEPDKDLQSMFLRHDNRLNRKRYLFRGLALGAAISVITKLITMIAVSMNSSAIAMLGTIISFVAVIPSFMLMIRRLHDLNRPAWWCIGVFVPLVNLVLGIYLLFFKGTEGPNDYGPDPLEVPGSGLL